ncbi:MAG: putative zinc-binding metallopeptidase [Bacteroidales bacterium]|nr:putative zinc-binding metallopeptidase [Bacteroidales bacterium]
MKRLGILYIIIALSVFAVSCEKDELNSESVIKVSQYEENDFDKWLRVNYLNPYNIDFIYRYEFIESDMNYYTVPSDMESSIMMAHLVKYLCIESYDEVAGIDFTRRYFPKMFFLIGEFEYRNNGTFILGTAEGGKKILLSGLNYLKNMVNNIEALNYYYIKTIHHEFVHILNQTCDFSADYQLITGTGYVADSWSEYPYTEGYLQRGFISAYSQQSADEDFAEMMSTYITNSEEWWNEQMEIAGEKGSMYITKKLDIVRSYMADEFNIDIDELRSTLMRRQKDIEEGKINLTSVEIK